MTRAELLAWLAAHPGATAKDIAVDTRAWPSSSTRGASAKIRRLLASLLAEGCVTRTRLPHEPWRWSVAEVAR